MSFHFHRATPRGEGALALFELYGAGAEAIVERLTTMRTGRRPAAGAAAFAELRDAGGKVLDEVVVARVSPAAMWSRLEAWTITVHGSIWLETRLGELLRGEGGTPLDREGVLALAVGEGVLDAVEAAAFAALVEAETSEAALFFTRQYQGELSARLRALAGRLEEGEEAAVLGGLEELLAGASQARRLREALDVQLLGRPNAGKSTLFNRLVEEERVAVTPLAGTTRDLLEERIALGGYPVRLTDSAGLRLAGETDDEVESEAVRRALARVRQDDRVHVLYLIPAIQTPDETDQRVLSELQPGRSMIVRTMTDLSSVTHPVIDLPPLPVLEVSAVIGKGLDRLRGAIVRRWIARGDETRSHATALPCAPFTGRQEQLLASAFRVLRDDSTRVDAVRDLLIECLRSSWPESNSLFPGSSESSAHGVEP